jgi:UDP-3-O-[3-hydroxymyristoyl] glucosamine N-acyltransferase
LPTGTLSAQEPSPPPRLISTPLGDIARQFNVVLADGVDPHLCLNGGASLSNAGASDFAYMDHPRYVDELRQTLAGACFVNERFKRHVPPGTVSLIVSKPYDSFARLLAQFHPDALRPSTIHADRTISSRATVHETAWLGEDVVVDPGVVIGRDARIGAGSVISANAVIGPSVVIGDNTSIGPHASITHAVVGSGTIIHSGVRIGQDGFGFAPTERGHIKVVQLGKVVIGDDVEIGANTTIDRGSSHDTIIGTGTKIDNLVQIGHNCQIGKHNIFAGQVGIAGSSTTGDYVVMAGQVGIGDHCRIGDRTMLGAKSGVHNDIPADQKMLGAPATPVSEQLRILSSLEKLPEIRREIRAIKKHLGMG